MRMERPVLVRAVLVLAVLVMGPLMALAATVELDGKLEGAPLPATFSVTGGDLYFNHDVPFVEVRGEGDCHYEFHQECYMAGNPPHLVCQQVPQWVCVQDRAAFRMPASLVLRGKDVFYSASGHDTKIGAVKSFLFWTWIRLGDNAKLTVTANRAVLRVDTGAGIRADREVAFAALYPEPVVDLMVKFQGVSAQEARRVLRKAGYDGELAPGNDWSAADVTHDELGVRLPVRQAAALIAKLKQSPRVVLVRPASTSAAE